MSYEKHATTLINCFTVTVHTYSAILLVETTLATIAAFAKHVPPVDVTSFLFNMYFGVLTVGIVGETSKLFYHLFFYEALKDSDNQKLEYLKAKLNQPLYTSIVSNKEGTCSKTVRYADNTEDDVKDLLAKLFILQNFNDKEDTPKNSDAKSDTTATATAATTTPTEPVTPDSWLGVTPDSASAKSNAETENYIDAKMAKMAKGPEVDGEITKAF